MLTTWVVVADSCKVRFFLMAGRNEPLTEINDIIHSEGRLLSQDDVSDRQGGISGSHGEGGHSFAAPTDVKQHEAMLFAKLIAEKLDHARVQHEYEKLILIAAPSFLGLLRNELNHHVLEMVSASLDKNLVTEEEAVIREHLLEESF